MGGQWVTERHRLIDPSVASVIFAPRQVGYLTYSAGSELKLGDLIRGFASTEEAPAVDLVLEADRLTGWERHELLLRFLPCLTETSVTTKSYRGTFALGLVIPDRKWPSKSHFNILALPVREGMSFDLDDFAER